MTRTDLDKLRRYRRLCMVQGPILIALSLLVPLNRLLPQWLPPKLYVALGDCPAALGFTGLMLFLLGWRLPVPKDDGPPRLLPRIVTSNRPTD